MNQIESILKEILEQVTEFRNNYISNEQAVRTQLIEPILNVLGWKTSRLILGFEDVVESKLLLPSTYLQCAV